MTRYEPINNSLFVENRKRYAEKLKAGALAIFHSNDEMPRNGDGFFPFRQNSDIFYLSGIDQEESILIILPDSAKPEFKEVLFIRKTNENIAIWEGHKYSKKEAQDVSGIKKVLWLEDFDVIFNEMMNHSNHCYINLNENDRYASPVEYCELRTSNQLKRKYPGHSFERSGPIMADLRAIKSQI
ncbi:aminopeptidase P N-terminal domain-containing protein, partial [bacterium AH-315-C07]|nr:aminopeptidase P N-terminal domain-containing protein [bacterium AH-315-C07]